MKMVERVAKAIEADRTKIIMAGSWTAEEECRRFAEAAIRAIREDILYSGSLAGALNLIDAAIAEAEK